MASQNRLAETRLLVVRDNESRFKQLETDRIKEHQHYFLKTGGSPGDLVELGLGDGPDSYDERVVAFLQGSTAEGLLVDASSLPKRFAFPVLKHVLSTAAAPNVVVTYTFGERHAGELGINYQEPEDIPRFGRPFPEPEAASLVMAVGHEHTGARKVLTNGLGQLSKRVLVLPYPAPQPALRKEWEFIRSVQKYFEPGELDPILLDPRDLPTAYATFDAMVDGVFGHTYFAPFGPKTFALAMCLVAIRKQDRTSVVYSQPSAYNPDYTQGVSMVPRVNGAVPATYCYCLKSRGTWLY